MWPIKQWIMDVREYWVETDSWSSLNGLICFIFLCRRHSFTFLSFFLIGDYWNAASFTTPSSYLHFATFQGETSADISFYFKTSAPYGVFLENLGNTDFIRLELKCKTHLIRIRSSGRPSVAPCHTAVFTDYVPLAWQLSRLHGDTLMMNI